VRLHWASHTQRLFLRRYTNDHISSNSRTSRFLAFASVFLSGGNWLAFFKPDKQGTGRNAEDARHRPQGTPLMVGSQDLGFGGFVVGIAAFVLATGLAAVMALVALPSVLKAEANEVDAAAVVARDCLSNHANSITRQLKSTHYLESFFGGSVESAVATLLSSQKTRPSDEELQRMEEMIQRARTEDKSDGEGQE